MNKAKMKLPLEDDSAKYEKDINMGKSRILLLVREYNRFPKTEETHQILNQSELINKTAQGNATRTAPTNHSLSSNKLCGFPTFCSKEASETCLSTTLSDCDQCNMAEAGILATLYIIVGCLIISGNGIVLWNVVTKRKGFNDTYSKIRASLAVADILSGLQIFFVILFNFGWTVRSSVYEIDLAEAALRGSTNAMVGGMFYLLGLTASLYHLLFLSSQRLYAIALPVRYKYKSKTSVYIGLAVVWVLAGLSATFPVWFPNKIIFTYYHMLFVYFPTSTGDLFTTTNQVEVLALVSLVCLLFLPYLLMTVLSLASGVMIHKYYGDRAKNLTASHKRIPRRVPKHEIHVLKTVVVMQVGFTITLLPLAIATTMFYAGSLTCANFSTPYFICFYLSLSHSFVNVMVYAFLSPKFRRSITAVLSMCLPRRFKKKVNDMAMRGKHNNNLSTSQTRSTDLTKSTGHKNLSTRHLPGMPSITNQVNLRGKNPKKHTCI